MRGQDDERFTVLAIEVFPALERDHSANPLLGTPPENAVFENGSAKGAKVPARKFLPVLVGRLREAQSQIHAHNAPAFPRKPIDQHPEAFAEGS